VLSISIEVILFIQRLITESEHGDRAISESAEFIVWSDLEYLLQRVIIDGFECAIAQPVKMLHHMLWIIILGLQDAWGDLEKDFLIQGLPDDKLITWIIWVDEELEVRGMQIVEVAELTEICRAIHYSSHDVPLDFLSLCIVWHVFATIEE
jgi:hypothetical protein